VIFVGFVPWAGITVVDNQIRRHLTDVGGAMQRLKV
jgi:hypothetical protein